MATTGVHGANRLASNSLLEGLVFGTRAAAAMIDQSGEFKPPLTRKNPKPRAPSATAGLNVDIMEAKPVQLSPHETFKEVRSILWDKVGIIRNGKDLCYALKRLNSLLSTSPASPSRQAFEVCNILEVGRIITRCALAREESRGADYRSDFLLKDESTPPMHSFALKVRRVFA